MKNVLEKELARVDKNVLVIVESPFGKHGVVDQGEKIAIKTPEGKYIEDARRVSSELKKLGIDGGKIPVGAKVNHLKQYFHHLRMADEAASKGSIGDMDKQISLAKQSAAKAGITPDSERVSQIKKQVYANNVEWHLKQAEKIAGQWDINRITVLPNMIATGKPPLDLIGDAISQARFLAKEGGVEIDEGRIKKIYRLYYNVEYGRVLSWIGEDITQTSLDLIDAHIQYVRKCARKGGFKPDEDLIAQIWKKVYKTNLQYTRENALEGDIESMEAGFQDCVGYARRAGIRLDDGLINKIRRQGYLKAFDNELNRLKKMASIGNTMEMEDSLDLISKYSAKTNLSKAQHAMVASLKKKGYAKAYKDAIEWANECIKKFEPLAAKESVSYARKYAKKAGIIPNEDEIKKIMDASQRLISAGYPKPLAPIVMPDILR